MTAALRADIGLVRYTCETCGSSEEVPHDKATRRRRRCNATFPARGDARCHGNAVRVSTAPRRTSNRDTVACSFCGEGQRETKKLIAGVLSYICDDCVLLAYEIVLEQDGAPPVATNFDDPFIRAVRAKTARELAATYTKNADELTAQAVKFEDAPAPACPHGVVVAGEVWCALCDPDRERTRKGGPSAQQIAHWRTLAAEASALPRESVNGPALARVITQLLDVVEARS